MSKRLIVLTFMLATLVVAASLVAVAAGGAAAQDPSPQQQITTLKKQLRAARLNAADRQDQVDAQNAVIEDKDAQITRLQNRLANLPDAIDVILARDPDGLWSAMVAIWRAFPTLDAGALCGYDRSSASGDAEPFTVTTYTFSRWSGC